jgi:GNAT superfamily N-acetyltransferase
MIKPVARSGLTERLANGDVRVRPATSADWDAVQALLGGAGERGCWCQYWRLSSSDYARRPPGAGAELMRSALRDQPSPGVVCDVDGEPAGWCGLWPRSKFERLNRSRTTPQVDDSPVWSIVCFMVRVGYRRRGVAAALLNGAIEYARSAGAPALEAYPIDAGDDRLDVAFSYVGFTSMFEKAGFERVVVTDAHSNGRPRILMRLRLNN